MTEPIADASGAVVGELIVMHDISAAKAEQHRLMAVAAGGSLVLLVGLLGFVFVLLGNTDKGIQQQQAMIRDSEARLRAITDSAQDAILMMDSRGAISFWNPAACNILGYRSEEVLGKNLHELLAPERYHEAQRKAFSDFARSGRGNVVGKTIELAARRKDGKEIAVALSLSAVSLNGQWHAVGILRDVTEKKQAADRLEEALSLSTRRQAETEALLAAARAVLENRTFEAAARRIFELCKHGVGATAGYVALLADNQEENEVLFLDAGPMPCNVDPSLPMPIRGLRSAAYRTCRPAYENDFASSEWVKYMPAGHVA
ncbi:MAG TPA: hypothetical protein DD670_19370, partial [Planctomycetaceae bacterium]|nr:hypothetical protein [Planctomycetaceae bacterium]